jgi:hypothetical protein
VKDPHRPDPKRLILTDEVGDRVLTRAAELDAAQRAAVEISELRAAATEAGISTSAFDTALGEMHEGGQAVAAHTQHERPRKWSLILAVSALLLIGAVTANRLGQSSAVPTVEQAFVLRCLAPAEAGELVRPMLDGTSTVVFSPNAPRVLTVRTTPDQLAEIRATLDQADGAACSGPSPAR